MQQFRAIISRINGEARTASGAEAAHVATPSSSSRASMPRPTPVVRPTPSARSLSPPSLFNKAVPADLRLMLVLRAGPAAQPRGECLQAHHVAAACPAVSLQARGPGEDCVIYFSPARCIPQTPFQYAASGGFVGRGYTPCSLVCISFDESVAAGAAGRDTVELLFPHSGSPRGAHAGDSEQRQRCACRVVVSRHAP